MKSKVRGDKDNRGFTLLEVLVSVCLLMVILLPISSSMLTALKINLKARNLMTATDVAQSIMESISEKNFSEVKKIVTSINTSGFKRADGKVGLSTIDNEYYNTKGNAYELNWSVLTAKGITDVKNSTMKIGGVQYNNVDLITNDHGLRDKMAEVLKTQTGAKKLYYCQDTDGKMLFLGYTGISSKGKTYDAVVYMIPVANSSSAKWYSYEVFVNVYEYKGEGSADRLTGNPTVSIKSGIQAKSGS